MTRGADGPRFLRSALPWRTGPDQATYARVLDRDGGCVLCGGRRGLRVLRRKPRRTGERVACAPDPASNPVSLCAADHTWVLAARDEAIEMGLVLEPTDDPRRVPVTHWRYEAAYLLDDGTVRCPPEWRP